MSVSTATAVEKALRAAATLTAVDRPPLPGVTDAPGWFAPVELLDGSGRLETMLAAVRPLFELSEPGFVAVNFSRIWAWYLLLIPVAGYLAADCVPDVSPDNVQLHLGAGGYVDQVRILEPRGFCSTDRDALRAEVVRVAVEAHLEPLIMSIRPYARMGVPALRLVITDTVVGALLHLIEALDVDVDVEAEVEAFLRLLPARGQAGVIWIEHDGRRHLFLNRAGCCLYYRVPEQEYCAACPHRPYDQRVEHLQAYVEVLAGEEVVA